MIEKKFLFEMVDAYVELGEDIGRMLRACGAVRCVVVLVAAVVFGADMCAYFA